MRPLQAHCHRSLGTLYAMTGQREQARAELDAASAVSRHGHDLLATPDRGGAGAGVLIRLGHQRNRAPWMTQST